MATTDGKTTPAVMAELAADPHAFDFYAAVRLIQTAYPRHQRVGYSSDPREDPVRFAQSPALDFAPATLEAFRAKDTQRPPVLYSRHFGLFGPNGPLPLCLTEYARDRILHHGDPTFTAFCNVFHHRLLSFFYRAWADARKTVDYDRPEDAHWPRCLASVIGLGAGSFAGRDEVPDAAKFFYSGRLAQQNRNAEGLEAIIQDFFGLPTRIETFVGHWLPLSPDGQCRFDGSPAARQLGQTAIVGARVWDCQMYFRLHMGPLKLAEFERLLPTGTAFKRLRDWIRLYTNDEFLWDLQLVLAKEEVPAVQLGRAGRLGWTTWLKTQPFDHDVADLVLKPPT